jgi:rhodanese-related sulfurtransferase
MTNNDGITSYIVGSLEDWFTNRHDTPLLDLRSDEEVAKNCHHVVLNSIHIPYSSVKQRSYELPPRQNAFAVLVPATGHEKQEALHLLQEFFLCQEDEETTITIDDKKNPLKRHHHHRLRRRSQKPWKVSLVILAEDETNWKQAKDLKCLNERNVIKINATTITTTSSSSSSSSSSIPFTPLPRLWQPDSMVKDILLPLLVERFLEKKVVPSHQHKDDHHPRPNTSLLHELWDLGAGAGRDVYVYNVLRTLAKERERETRTPWSSTNNGNKKTYTAPLSLCVLSTVPFWQKN